MLRVYFLQQWYGLADEALEDALYDSQALRSFAAIELGRDPVPDATTVLHFRHWLERHGLSKALFDEVAAPLTERGLLMREGTIVDATIISAPSATKNQAKARDPEMHQAKKGNQWYFGMRAHLGVDAASGLVHRLTSTAANEADINQTAALLHGEEKAVFADAGYTGAAKTTRTGGSQAVLEHRHQAQDHQRRRGRQKRLLGDHQIGQREQAVDLSRVLVEAAVAHFAVMKAILDDVEGMLDPGLLPTRLRDLASCITSINHDPRRQGSPSSKPTRSGRAPLTTTGDKSAARRAGIRPILPEPRRRTRMSRIDARNGMSEFAAVSS
jgi:IS5 family transposase